MFWLCIIIISRWVHCTCDFRYLPWKKVKKQIDRGFPFFWGWFVGAIRCYMNRSELLFSGCYSTTVFHTEVTTKATSRGKGPARHGPSPSCLSSRSTTHLHADFIATTHASLRPSFVPPYESRHKLGAIRKVWLHQDFLTRLGGKVLGAMPEHSSDKQSRDKHGGGQRAALLDSLGWFRNLPEPSLPQTSLEPTVPNSNIFRTERSKLKHL